VTVSLRHDQGVPVDALLERARRLPGVTHVAMANAVPLASSGPETIVAVDAAGSRTTRAERAIVTPDYFTMFGVALRRGRALDARDGASAARVALVNDLVASRLWPRGDDLGAQVWIDGVAHEIVGRVAARASMALSTPSAAVYLPLAQEATPPGRLELVVRTDGDARRLVAPLREALAGAHGASVLRVLTLRDVQIVAGEEILATAFPMVPLISTAILLAATGIYGVLAFATTRRAREIALRIALGASRRDVAWLVASQAVRLVLIGGLCGLGVTWLLTRLAQGAGGVFDGPGWQAFAAPGALLGAIALLAAWIPARRAVRLDPAVLLRES
jgi:putative ABC transport system permease protein